MKWTIFPFVLLLCACSYSQGFHRDRTREESAALPETNDAGIQAELAKRPQLPKPFRLGLYFREPIRTLGGGSMGLAAGRFSGLEKAEILDWARRLPREEVAAVVPIQAEAAADLRFIRLEAARHGVDAVLVVSATAEEAESANGLALLNLLVLPAFVVHGSEVETFFSGHAALWDVRNEYLYMTAEGEAGEKRARPLLFRKAEEQALETRRQAMENLQQEMRAQLGGLLAAGSAVSAGPGAPDQRRWQSMR